MIFHPLLVFSAGEEVTRAAVRTHRAQKQFSFSILILVLPLLLGASVPDPRPTPGPPPEITRPAPEWKGTKAAASLDQLHRATLTEVERVLRANRPAWPETGPRKLALLALDEVLHYMDPDAKESPAVKGFYCVRLDLAASEMDRTRVAKGMVIWKLYNHGFAVRTPSVTVAFDLTRGWLRDGGPAGALDPLRRVVAQCDALFLSHDHGDHVDPLVIHAFLDHGKPVIAPEGLMATEKRILRLTRDPKLRHRVDLATGRALEVVVLPGWQGRTLCNVPLVWTPEGFSLAHTGDLDQKSGNTPAPEDMWAWIDTVKDHWQLDVLMVNIWADDLLRVIRGFGAALVLTGHENELQHGLEQRKPHCQAFERLGDFPGPWMTMAWGESFWYQPARKR